MLGLPGLDVTLLIFSLCNTSYLFVFWTCTALAQRDMYASMAAGRLVLSLPIGGMCTAIFFFGEHTKVYPFLCACCVLLYLLVWSFTQLWPLLGKEEQWASKEEQLHHGRKRYMIVGFMFITSCWLVSIIVFFALRAAGLATGFLYDSECPATTNKAMPVRIKGVTEWQCVKWGVARHINRVPTNKTAVYNALYSTDIYHALCSTSFHAFNTAVSQSMQAPSSAAHYVQCPSNCQLLGLGSSVVGCKTYSATSSICSAAVQMGILQKNAGGLVKVVGRQPPLSYGRCNQRGILSTDTPPLATPQSPAWAFYFQQVDGMADVDMVTLHGWKRTSIPGAREPWKSYSAIVTWIVGSKAQHREVQLGPNNGDIEVNFCRGAVNCK
jgi:hypothetical protein